MELATDVPLTLIPRVECHKLTTGGYGPLLSERVKIILERSRLISQGFIVHPRIIEGNSKEKIKIMAYIKKRCKLMQEIESFSCYFLTLKARPLQEKGQGFGEY